MPNIVTVNVNVAAPPTPSNLQKIGALISVGGTNLTANVARLLTQLADLTPLVPAALTLSSLSWAGGTVTATASAPHGFPVGQQVALTIAGTTPAAYNGNFTATITTATQFTYPLVSNPGATSVVGTVVPSGVAELNQMATTFFAQGGGTSVYVFELGLSSVANAISNLSAYITANPLTFYRYLVPRAWDSVAAFLSLVAQYENATARQYFHPTTTAANYTNYTGAMKDVFALVEAPGLPATEFTAAAPFYRALAYTPLPNNRVAPFAFGQMFGVTPYPTIGNGALFTSFKAGFTNIILTGAEGGLTPNYLYWGTMEDGNDLTYWYSVDWVQITSAQQLAAAVINGSNNSQNPLYYNQDGINRLQQVLASVMNIGVQDGLVLGTVTQYGFDQATFNQNLSAGLFDGQCAVNAIPFLPYLTVNPGDYTLGRYAGFTIVFTPARGFTQIVLNIVVANFVAT